MPRPLLIIVTGEPGSGKSTLGRAIAEALHLPYLSRDDVRWGLRATAGLWTNDMGTDVDRGHTVETFLQWVESTARLGVTAVLEYMVFTWNPETLERLTAAADCLVIVTHSADATERSVSRDRDDPLLNNSDVLAALGLTKIDDYFDLPGRELVRGDDHRVRPPNSCRRHRRRLRTRLLRDHRLDHLSPRVTCRYARWGAVDRLEVRMEVALVWIVLICCTTFVAALAVGKDRRPGLTPEARLAQRFADGEIDEGEFLVQLSMVRDAKQASELNP